MLKNLCRALLFFSLVLPASVLPAAETKRTPKELIPEVKTWTLEGPLGELPKRTTDDLPLSDQANEANWLPYAPLTDEFAAAELDTQKWSPKHRHWDGRQPALFSPDNVVVSDGQLQLWMRKEDPPAKYEERGYHTYTSASVQSKTEVTYGYFEVRAQPMNSAGSSSFWFAGSGNGWRTELDVFELGGKAKGHERIYNMKVHVFYCPGLDSHWDKGGKWKAPWNLAADFHTYGVDWNAEEIVYYVDGVAIRRVENTHWHQPLYLIFDSETMGNWLGMPADEDLPSVFRVNYVRAWKRAAKGALPTTAALPLANRE